MVEAEASEPFEPLTAMRLQEHEYSAEILPTEAEAVLTAEAHPDRRALYVRRSGYSDLEFVEGTTAAGVPAYFVEVARKLAGWNITMRLGNKRGEAVMHLSKGNTWQSMLGWDKGSKVQIQVSQAVNILSLEH